MLDIILIQHNTTGINLLEYRQEDTQFDSNHSDIFSGFLSAIQNISVEIDIGTLVLISTEGTKGHNCIIVPYPPISVIILVDTTDPVDLWKEQGRDIAELFIKKYGKDFSPSSVGKFDEFKAVIKDMCAGHRYCE